MLLNYTIKPYPITKPISVCYSDDSYSSRVGEYESEFKYIKHSSTQFVMHRTVTLLHPSRFDEDQYDFILDQINYFFDFEHVNGYFKVMFGDYNLHLPHDGRIISTGMDFLLLPTDPLDSHFRREHWESFDKIKSTKALGYEHFDEDNLSTPAKLHIIKSKLQNHITATINHETSKKQPIDFSLKDLNLFIVLSLDPQEKTGISSK